MKHGSVFQRHTRRCPRDSAGRLLPHKCHGPWAYTLFLRRGTDGRKREISKSGFPTNHAAALALREVVARDEAGLADLHGLAVGTYLQQWLEGKRSIRDTTRRNYEAHIRRYLMPSLGRVKLLDLRPHHIDGVYNELLRSGANVTTVHHLHRTLRSALNTAVKRRLLPWNPALHVELPPSSRNETAVWPPEQLGHFLDVIADHRLYAMFHLIAMAGLRRGEALGLHWDDVDLEREAVRVRLQLVDAGHGAKLGPPKTKTGARIVPLDRATAAVLREHRARQDAERTAWGRAWHDTGLVFTREDGTQLRPDYVSHLFQDLVNEAGVPRIRLHDLRHTNASLALAAGVPMKAVSHRLGHSSMAITADLYTHVIPAVAQDVAERIAAIVPRRSAAPEPTESCASPSQEPSEEE